MTGLAIALALLAALAASGYRLTRRVRLRRQLAALPGGSRATAVAVEAFPQMDEHLLRRECRCAGLLAVHGERSETVDQHRYRIARVECRRCEERGEVWFDVTRAYN